MYIIYERIASLCAPKMRVMALLYDMIQCFFNATAAPAIPLYFRTIARTACFTVQNAITEMYGVNVISDRHETCPI